MSVRRAAAANRASTKVASEAETTSDLAGATQVLAQAVQTLSGTMAQLQRMTSMGAGITPQAAVQIIQINTWDDDPFSELTPTADPPVAPVITVDVPVNNNPQLQTAIVEPRPAPSPYQPGTPEFRYWSVEEALARGINFWSPLLPAGTTWSAATNPLQVALVFAVDLNAFYGRPFGLRFYRWPAQDPAVFSAESPDIVLHELGHGILDAVNRGFFDMQTLENAAFHESFGDMSAILSSLQLPTMRQKVTAETGDRLNANSRLSRLAERLGRALRQVNPAAAERDCLRNASNRFTYQRPESLPADGSASELTSEVHSFSRIFTGAFLDALAGMARRNGAISDANLLAVSRDMGQILVDAVRLVQDTPTSPWPTWPYAEVAAAMIQSDQARNGGRYRDDLTGPFLRRGILSSESVEALATAPVPTLAPVPQAPAPALGFVGPDGPASGAAMLVTYDEGNENHDYALGFTATSKLPTRTISTSIGVDLQVHAPDRSQPPEAPSSAVGLAGGFAAAVMQPQDEALYFVERLIQQGRIEFDPATGVTSPVIKAFAATGSTKTHRVVKADAGDLVLERVQFNCGVCGDR